MKNTKNKVSGNRSKSTSVNMSLSLGLAVVTLSLVAVQMTQTNTLDNRIQAAQKRPSPTKAPIFCTDIYTPVCGSDGRTYSNDCYAQAANVRIECNQACPCGDQNNAQPIPFDVNQ